MKERLLTIAQDLLACPTAPFREHAVQSYIKDFCQTNTIHFRQDDMGNIIMDKLKPKALLVTLGEDGMILFEGKENYHIPTAALEVFDVSGAGDTVIAAFTLALSCGSSFFEAATVANYAAGVVVGKLGAATTSKWELFQRIDES